MRIIAGKKKGMKLQAPKGLNTRPTTDRVKENLFNILQRDVRGRTVLDLFAGTGALGIEAMSRGAKKAVFIEKDHHTYARLCENLHKVADLGEMRTCRKDAFTFLIGCKEQFDMVFLDPPYQMGLSRKAVQILVDKDLLLTGALIILECHRDEEIFSSDELVELGLKATKLTCYGSTAIKILQKI